MPRIFDRVRKPLDTEIRSDRNRKSSYYRTFAWIDPYPNVQGTLPEKMVFAKLMQFRIKFNYQTYLQVKIPEIEFNRWYRPDFVIPDAKIIIEVQGFYWHSQEQQIVSDAFKQALYETIGYKVITWWDFEIMAGIDRLIINTPELRALFGTGGRVFTGNEVERDDTAGIAKANKNRTDYGKRRAKYKYSTTGRQARTSYSIL